MKQFLAKKNKDKELKSTQFFIAPLTLYTREIRLLFMTQTHSASTLMQSELTLPENDFDPDGCSNKSQRSINYNIASPYGGGRKKMDVIGLDKATVQVPFKNPSSVSNVTSELSGVSLQSITSKEKQATENFKTNILTSASLQNESQTSYQVGLNIHSELCTNYNTDLKNSLRKCILKRKPEISFCDIAGCEYAKECIKMSFVIPNQCPDIFEMNNVRPWQSLLLYGPPGVGKTMLTQAVVQHSDATCFWVSVSDLTSKYIGESEQKLILLFELAIEHAPSIILIDEMDSLGRRRTGNESETERRIKTEFLRQMDMIRRIKEKVSVFATTNMPWELDIAALRRFERRILVPMPNHQDRYEVLRLHAGKQHALTEEDFNYLAAKTNGYSGSDLSTLVNDALMRPIKQLQSAQYFKRIEKTQMVEKIDLYRSNYLFYYDQEEDPNQIEQSDLDLTQSYWMPLNLSKVTASQKEQMIKEPGVMKLELPNICQKNLLHRKADLDDFKACMDSPTVLPAFLELYVKFQQKYGHKEQNKCVQSMMPTYLGFGNIYS